VDVSLRAGAMREIVIVLHKGTHSLVEFLLKDGRVVSSVGRNRFVLLLGRLRGLRRGRGGRLRFLAIFRRLVLGPIRLRVASLSAVLGSLVDIFSVILFFQNSVRVLMREEYHFLSFLYLEANLW
jgi:hypothetical protein